VKRKSGNQLADHTSGKINIAPIWKVVVACNTLAPGLTLIYVLFLFRQAHPGDFVLRASLAGFWIVFQSPVLMSGALLVVSRKLIPKLLAVAACAAEALLLFIVSAPITNKRVELRHWTARSGSHQEESVIYLGSIIGNDFDPPYVWLDRSPHFKQADNKLKEDVIRLTVEASDNVSIGRVSLFLDGAHLRTWSDPPYNYDWTLPCIAGGKAHTINAIAVDGVGNKTITEDEVIVANGPC
jgi:hypothetical protein